MMAIEAELARVATRLLSADRLRFLLDNSGGPYVHQSPPGTLQLLPGDMGDGSPEVLPGPAVCPKGT